MLDIIFNIDFIFMKIHFSKSTMYCVLAIFVLAFDILEYFIFTCDMHMLGMEQVLKNISCLVNKLAVVQLEG